ncbi:MAG: hypothetical protein Q7U48_13810 [Hydrogenophaga sp.]|nr:hypothetical protein [Hydrogenophaga sp.]
MSNIIKPSVGRKVWYWPSVSDKTGPVPMSQSPGQPLDATVIAVWSDRMVNVLVTDTMGKQFPVLSCDLQQPGDPVHVSESGQVIGRYVEWMPYQVATAPNPTDKDYPQGPALSDADAMADLAGLPRADNPGLDTGPKA